MRTTHTPLSDAEIAELQALCSGSVSLELERVRGYVSRMILDLLALRSELRRERERALAELERLHDVLSRTRRYVERRSLDDELEALRAEIEDALARRGVL
jgi:hypothetical protein